MNFSESEFCITMVVIQLCISTIGYVGHIITCIIIASNKSMYTTTNVYLFNLAIADFLMLTTGLTDFTIPYWYSSKDQHKELEACVIRKTILNSAFNVSIMTIMAFTIERYLAICHPFLARRMLSIPKAIKLIFIIWIIGSLFGFLYGYHHTIVYNSTFSAYTAVGCFWNDTVPYIINVQCFFFFIVPFLLLTVLYILIWKKLAESSKIQKNQGSNGTVERSPETQNDDENSSNRKIFKLLKFEIFIFLYNVVVTVVAVFFISWGPYHICRLYEFNFADDLIMHEMFFTSNEYFMIIREIGYAIYTTTYFISASANPIIYNAMSKKFRDAFKEVFIKLWFDHRKVWGGTKDKQEAIKTRV